MTGSISLASRHAGGPVRGKDQGDGLLTASRALLNALMEAFFDVPPRRTSVARITSRGPGPGSRPMEPAAKLEHRDAPKLEAVVVPVESAPKALTNVRACNRARVAMKRGASRTVEYRTWSDMKSRCGNQSVDSYPYYGGRGIRVLYESFEAFLADVGPRPDPGYSIDRKDSYGHYGPGGCQWATAAEQGRNRRPGITPITVADPDCP